MSSANLGSTKWSFSCGLRKVFYMENCRSLNIYFFVDHSLWSDDQVYLTKWLVSVHDIDSQAEELWISYPHFNLLLSNVFCHVLCH